MALSPAEKKTRLLETTLLPREEVEGHFRRLDNDYWNEFPLEEIQQHLAVLGALTTSTPYSVRLQSFEAGLRGLTLIGGDFPGFFAAVSGFLTSDGYDIHSGKAFSFSADPRIPALPQGGIIDFLLLRCDDGACADPQENDRLQCEMEGLFRRFRDGESQKIRVDLYRRIGKRLERRNGLSPSAAPLEIHTHLLNTGAQISIRGADREAMLFCIAAAVSLRGLSIEKLLTTANEDGTFEDRLTVTEVGRRPMQGAAEMEKLRVGIALMERLLETLPAATDLQAAVEGLQALVEDWLEESSALSGSGSLEVLPALSRVLTAGPYLWERVARIGPASFRRLLEELSAETLHPTRENFLAALRAAGALSASGELGIEEISAFREREVLKSELDLLLTPARDLNEFSQRLQALAEALLLFTAQALEKALIRKHGIPAPYALFALGKFGGEELGAGSDLEILLIYSGPGETSGPEQLRTGEFYERLLQNLSEALRTRPGETLSLDLRLRPHGESGPLAVSLPAWRSYFSAGGGALDYEKQSLIRLRFLHGDPDLSRHVLDLRDGIAYADPPVSIGHTLELHARQTALKTRPGTWNAKYSAGGMAELEYAVQFLQLAHGAAKPLVRRHNLDKALESLLETGLLTLAEFEHLYSAHLFLRRLINALRLVRGQARDLHCPAPDSSEFPFLAKRMGYVSRPDSSDLLQLERDLRQTQRVVGGFFRYRFEKGEKPEWLYESLSENLMDPEASLEDASRGLLRLGMRDLPRARRLLLELFDQVLEKRLIAACLLVFETPLHRSPDPEGVIQKWTRYLGMLRHPDVFIRQSLDHPSLLETLFTVFANSEALSEWVMREAEGFKILFQPEVLEKIRLPEEFDAAASQSLKDARLGEEPETRLCRLRNREYVRIALRDLRLSYPLREITYEISCLSDALLKSALRHVLESAERSELESHFCVLALGKLGGLELNYSSDIDLIFVLDDALDGEGREACEKIGKALIGFLTHNTPEGRLFRVDMNLRPWGGPGPLAGTETQYVNYYAREAGGWELQAWLKARAVCGNKTLGERLVRGVQRMACAPENREKVASSMRKVRLMGLDKLHREHLLSDEVKLGPGGIRTVEFFAQALQVLHGAELPELLTGNTLEALGRLNRYQLLAGARFHMLSEAYIFLRRVEHRLQLQGLQQRHALPRDSGELHRLARQMGFEDRIGQSAVDGFLEQYRKHMLSLQSLSAELFAH